MSNAHNEHESVIKTPKQLVAAVIAAFLIPIICIILLVQYVSNESKSGAGSDSLAPEAVAERLKPVADVGFTLKDVNAPKVLQTGEAVYKAVCAACHTTGAAGAPKTGDAAGWSSRISQGQATLVEHAIKGIRAMPAKGGNPDLDDVEVERAVVFMANQSGGKLKEPVVKEAAPAAASANAAPAASEAGAQTASATQPLTSSPSQQTQALAAAAPAAKADGKKVFDASCAACHGAGVAGAPKVGDKAAWAPRIQQGSATLYEHAIKGFQGKAGMMPPKGGSSASDEEVKAAVDYMADASK
ncbi:c-type cytochrome [Noviherbaspirillum sp. Root189]|uniref:c-type cytochrome n=1 Tax=Noviherbaspirillum sp. Root189 TaxID=1736487 RepID=UPI000708DE0C|nr:c-type cytochrome [Noviherbaspirillum sp. Root189]KRB94104.1 cytochrome C [Noviherbaspirillum sp. Root189]